jgi:hypothetical protein
MATLDGDDVKQIEEIINNIIRKNRIAEHIREGKKEQKERPIRRIRLSKEYGLALFAAGSPLLFAGIWSLIFPNISTDWALFISGGIVAILGFLFLAFAKEI